MIIKDEKGIALILALVVIALLVSLAVDFTYTMRVDLTLANNLRDETEAFYIARSGVETARLILKKDDPIYDALDEEWAHFNENQGFISEDDEGKFTGEIEDEASKIPINGAVTDTKEIVTRLFELLELEHELIDSIRDWIDPDSEQRPLGAEDPYYRGLSEPYPCKDGPLDTPEELLLVKGMTEEILYGDAKEEKEGIMPYITVYSEGKVNINTASPLVLQSLSERIDETVAQTIVDYRQDVPFKDIKDLKNVPGITDEIYNHISPYIDVKSSIFSLRLEGLVRGIKKEIWVVLRREGKEAKPIFWRVE